MGNLGLALVIAIVAAGPETTSKAAPATKDVRATIERSLPFLEREGVAWKEKKGCASCHHVPMMIWTHHEAQKHGFTLNQKVLDEAETWAIGHYLDDPEFKPTGQDKGFPKRGPGPGAVYLALGVGAAKHRADPAASALSNLSDHFVKMQESDGSWALKETGPPLVDGDDVATLFILLAMDKSDKDPGQQAQRKALKWLEQAPRRDENQPLALRTMVAARYGSADEAKKSAARLRESQRADGGWAQVSERSSDAVATGQSLCALLAAGDAPESPPIRRAVNFLVGSQRGDGSWLVTSRKPKNHTDIVSYYGTGWATIGLLRSLPD